MEDNREIIKESLNKIRGMMNFEPGMTRTENEQIIKEQFTEPVKEKDVDEDVKEEETEVEVDVEVKEEDVAECDDVKEEPKEGYTNMAIGFAVNESVSNKEQKRINKEARRNKKLGIIEEQFANPAMMANMAGRRAVRQVKRGERNPRAAARQARRADRRSDRTDRKSDFQAAIGKEPKQDVGGKIYTDFDKVWDYKFTDNMWYTRRKGQEKWISLANYPVAIKKLNAKYFPSANDKIATPQAVRTPAPGKIDTSKITSPIIPTAKPDTIKLASRK